MLQSHMVQAADLDAELAGDADLDTDRARRSARRGGGERERPLRVARPPPRDPPVRCARCGGAASRPWNPRPTPGPIFTASTGATMPCTMGICIH